MQLPLSGEGSIITVQISRLSDNGPGPLPEGLKDGPAKYPVTFVEKSIFESRIRAKYRLLLFFEEEDTLSRVGGRMITIRGVGYLAEKPVA